MNSIGSNVSEFFNGNPNQIKFESIVIDSFLLIQRAFEIFEYIQLLNLLKNVRINALQSQVLIKALYDVH